MRDSHGAGQGTHVARPEYIAYQTRAFVHVEGIAFSGCDTGSILSAMLQYHQPVIEQLVYRRGCNDPENPAHIVPT